METPNEKGKSRNFVKTVAWIFIFLSGMSVLMTLMQNIVIATMPGFESMTPDSELLDNVPFMTKFFISNIRLYLLFGLLFSLLLLISAIGLLKFKAWARRLFSIMLSIGIVITLIVTVWYLVALISGTGIFAVRHELPMGGFIIIIQTISLVFTIAVALFAVWIVKKLENKKLKSLFQ